MNWNSEARFERDQENAAHAHDLVHEALTLKGEDWLRRRALEAIGEEEFSQWEALSNETPTVKELADLVIEEVTVNDLAVELELIG